MVLTESKLPFILGLFEGHLHLVQKEKATVSTVCLSLILGKFPLLFICSCGKAEAHKLVIFQEASQTGTKHLNRLRSFSGSRYCNINSVFYDA